MGKPFSVMGLAICLAAGLIPAGSSHAQSPSTAQQTASQRGSAAIDHRQLGTSFDCSRTGQDIPALVCGDPELRVADLRQMQVYYALRHAAPTRVQDLRSQFLSRVQALVRDCSAEPVRVSASQKACTMRGLNEMRSHWLAQLQPLNNAGAVEEAGLSVEQLLGVQSALQRSGLIGGSSTIDGVYGTMTRDALARFQRDRSLEGSGFANLATVRQLLGAGGPATSATSVPQRTPSQPQGGQTQGETSRSVEGTLERLRAQQPSLRSASSSGGAPAQNSRPDGATQPPLISNSHNDNISPAELHAIIEKFRSCLSRPSISMESEIISVGIRLQVDSRGTVRNTFPAQDLSSDPRRRAIYESIRRAFLDPRCGELSIPTHKYTTLMSSVLIFNMQGQGFTVSIDSPPPAELERRRRELERLRLEQEARELAERERQQQRQNFSSQLALYQRREKTLLEQILNYSTTSFENGSTELFWISGYRGDHRCVLTPIESNPALETYNKIDIRNFNERGFRVNRELLLGAFWIFRIGDEATSLTTAAPVVPQRLQDAWRLAFRECPGRRSAF